MLYKLDKNELFLFNWFLLEICYRYFSRRVKYVCLDKFV